MGEIRRSMLTSLQRDAGARYHVQPQKALASDPGAVLFRAMQPAPGLVAEFGSQGVALRSTDPGGTWALGLDLVGLGREDQTEEARPAVVSASGNRVSYRRGDLEEWYLNGPWGLEQGFTLAAKPGGTGLLVAEVAVSGDLFPALLSPGRTIGFFDAAGHHTASYKELFALDASGRSLPSSMGLVGDRIQLVVDDTGAIYPVVIDPLLLSEETELIPADAAADDHFGASVALEGDTLLVGATGVDGGGYDRCGAVYVFELSGSTWNETAKIAPDPCPSSISFGRRIALSGDTALIGRSDRKVDVYVRSGAVWSIQDTLETPGITSSFGRALDLDGDRAVIGDEDQDNPDLQQGAAYIFVRDQETWSLEQELTNPDAIHVYYFGSSVALLGDWAIVGAEYYNGYFGTAAVYHRSGGYWGVDVQLIPSGMVEQDHAGTSVAIDHGPRVAVAGWNWDSHNGFVYVFTRQGADDWSEDQKLVPSEPDNYLCGRSLAIDGDVLVVTCSNSAFLFEQEAGVWTEQLGFTGADIAASEQFGTDIALQGTRAVAGAYWHDHVDNNDGAAYVFEFCPTGLFYVAGYGCTFGCAQDTDCDDQKICTTDSCDLGAGYCVFEPIPDCCTGDWDCDDGDVCTTGSCNLATNSCSFDPIEDCCSIDDDCDDGDDCTTDSCDLSLNSCENEEIVGCCTDVADCDDSDVCTTDSCNLSLNTCENEAIAGCCTEDEDCDDGDICTQDICSQSTGECTNSPTYNCCLDQADCPSGYLCQDNECVPEDGADGDSQGRGDTGCGCRTTGRARRPGGVTAVLLAGLLGR